MKIVFAHNVYNRYATLKNTIEIENNLFPDSKISVAHNGDEFIKMSDVKIVNFNEKPHKIGCVNGCILSIQQLLNDEFSVLIFSHDDVFINANYIKTVTRHIEDINNGVYDIICRKPSCGYGDNYYMMEIIYFSKFAAVEIFREIRTFDNENSLPCDIRDKISPEVWLYNIFNNKNLKIKIIEFEPNNISTYNEQLNEQMGFTHKNAGIRGWTD